MSDKYQIQMTKIDSEGNENELYFINRAEDVKVGKIKAPSAISLPAETSDETLEVSIGKIKKNLSNLYNISKEKRNVSDRVDNDSSIDLATSKSVKIVNDKIENKLSIASSDYTKIISNQDLNTIRTPGAYKFDKSIASDVANLPEKNLSLFKLIVEELSDENRIRQTLYSGDNGYIYARTFNTNTWSEWVIFKEVTWKNIPDKPFVGIDPNTLMIDNGILKVISVVEKTTNVVPYALALTYNGKEQSPEWIGWNPDVLELSGTVKGINAGEYIAEFQPRSGYKWTDGTGDIKAVSWFIKKATINPPTVSGDFTYDKLSHNPTIIGFNENIMIMEGSNSAINAGEYEISITPKSNYMWSDGTTTAKKYKWTIRKASVLVPIVTGDFTYSRSEQSPSISRFQESVMKKTGVSTAINSGTYTITFSLLDNKNYRWEDDPETASSGTRSSNWFIRKKALTIPVVTTNYSYDGSEKTIPLSEYDQTAINISGTTKATNASINTVTLSIIDKDNYTWSDGSVSDITRTWKIEKTQITASVDVSLVNLTIENPEVSVIVTSNVSLPINLISVSDGLICNISDHTLNISAEENSSDGEITFNILGNENLITSETITITVKTVIRSWWGKWVELGGLNKSNYTNIDEVLADEAAVRRLMSLVDSVDYLVDHLMPSDENVVTKLIASENVLKWIGLRTYASEKILGNTTYKDLISASSNSTLVFRDGIPLMYAVDAPYGKIFASNNSGGENLLALSDPDETELSWTYYVTGSTNNTFVGYIFPYPTMVDVMKYMLQRGQTTASVTIQIEGSVNTTTGLDGTWEVIKTVAAKSYTANTVYSEKLNTTKKYKGYRIKYIGLENAWVKFSRIDFEAKIFDPTDNSSDEFTTSNIQMIFDHGYSPVEISLTPSKKQFSSDYSSVEPTAEIVDDEISIELSIAGDGKKSGMVSIAPTFDLTDYKYAHILVDSAIYNYWLMESGIIGLAVNNNNSTYISNMMYVSGCLKETSSHHTNAVISLDITDANLTTNLLFFIAINISTSGGSKNKIGKIWLSKE